MKRTNRVPKWAQTLIFWLVSGAVWALVWHIASVKVGQPLLLPSPAITLTRLFQLMTDAREAPAFWLSLLSSLGRVLLGLVCGVAVAVCLAPLSYFFKPMRALIAPAMTVIRSTPVASFIILLLLWVDREAVPTVISFLMVLPVMWASLNTALGEVNAGLLEMAAAYRMSAVRTVRYVYLPDIMPSFLSSLKNCSGLAWKAGIAAEVLTLPFRALGTNLYYTKLNLETADLFAWTLTVILLSLLLEGLMNACDRGIRAYKAGRRKKQHERAPGQTRPATSETVFDADAVKRATGDPLVSLANVSFSYRKDGVTRDVLDGFSLSVDRGQAVALMGRSGSGKTTVLKLLAGLASPDGGSVQPSPDLRAAVVFQDTRLFPGLTVMRNIQVSCPSCDAGTVEALLDCVGLGDCAYLYPDELSGGMARRVELCRAFCYAGNLLILDEPFTGLDPEAVEKCVGLVNAYREKTGASVALVTHSEREAGALDCRIVRMPEPDSVTDTDTARP